MLANKIQRLSLTFSVALLATVITGGNANGQIFQNQGGIEITTEGVLNSRVIDANAKQLDQQRFAAATASLNKDLQKPSKFRKISLTRLEKEIAALRADGKPVPEDMAFLAGLTRITHVFFYPETKDVVIAGPAEGYYINGLNRAVGMTTGQATVQLQDLIAALRAFSPQGDKTRMIGCSIDPTREGLQRMQQAVRNVQQNARPGDEAEIVRIYQEALGPQTITVQGVSPKTHFAHVMVEADYEMKMIGLGLRQTPVRITSYAEKSRPGTAARNSLQRWFFQPDYSCVHMTEDKTAMQLVGQGVKLVGEDESVNAAGNRKGSGGMNGASRAFTNSFTKMYSKLAKRAPLFGELRNLIDMSITAAYLQKMDIYGQAGWEMTTFGDESVLPIETLYAPKQVAPVVSPIWRGNTFAPIIGGGVDFQPRIALNSDRINGDDTGEIAKARDSVDVDSLEDGQWWWD